MDGDPPELRESGRRPGSAKSAAANFKPFKALGQVATAIARTAGSAIALVEDAELRKKASDIVIGQANKGFNTVKQGVAHGAETVGQRIQAGPRQVQSVLGSLQKRIEEQRLANALREERDAPVDVQIGPQLYKGAHQELRRRLWVALLDNASLSHSVTRSALSQNGSEAMGSVCQSPGRTSFRGHSGMDALSGGSTAAADPVTDVAPQLPSDAASSTPVESAPAESNIAAESQGASAGNLEAEGITGPLAAVHLSGNPPDGVQSQRSAEFSASASPVTESPRMSGYSWATRKAGSGQTEVVRVPSCAAAGISDAAEAADGLASLLTRQPQMSSAPDGAKHQPETVSDVKVDSQDSRHSSPPVVRHNSQAQAQGESPRSSSAQEAVPKCVSPAASAFQIPSVPPPSGVTSGDMSRAGLQRSQRCADEDAWEMVQEGSGVIGFECTGLGGAAMRLHPSENEHLSPEDVAVWQKLMIAISTVPPVSTEYAEDSRYNTLLQISIGQEETDDIIARDINRTFPEHPQFGYEQGQRALFRVLKAYSLHDLEVQYCQGMGFVAGVMLMYLPEEPAFRMLMRLLDERGPNLRRLYLPALEGLKYQLRCLEWLLERHSPRLASHLQRNMVTPVLYASQWFLTLFACPFPSAFCARIIDIILFTGHTEILLQTALAVVVECEVELLARDDFEDILTYLKVEPVQWKHIQLRGVLNTAIASVVTSEMVRAADFAVSTGYCGSLSRRSTSRHDLTAGMTPAPGRHSRNHSVVSAAILPSPRQADGEGVNAAELSAALHNMGSSEEDPGEVAASEATPTVLGADDLEMVLAVEMLRAPSENHLASSEHRLDPIKEQGVTDNRDANRV